MPPGKRVKAKKSCCESEPRCRNCPVVCRRLEKRGLAVREGKRTWVLLDVGKGAFKAARAK